MAEMDRSSSVLLTKRAVDAAQPSGTRYHVCDSKLAGFALRVEASGTKTFVVRYRADDGGRSAPRRFVTIGRYGTLTVDEARKQAKTILGAAAKGDDPANDRGKKRREITMAKLIDLYEEEGCFIQRGQRQGEPMKERTKAYTLARLRHHVVPLLGRKRVSEIGTGEIERFVRDVAAGKTARDEKTGPRKRIIVRGGDGAARKVVRDLSAVFSFANRRGIMTVNPVEKASVRKTDNRRERFLTLEEVAKLGAAFDALEAEGANPKAIAIARLWALTGCRRDEIAGLRWSEVDFERGLLILADSKTGKSIRPLGAAAIALLHAVDRDPEASFVFPAELGDSHYQGTKRLWPKVIQKATLPGVTPHTLRHTMGSTAVSSGEALALTGAILGHANLRSTAIYAHVQNDPSKRAADRVTKKIANALAGKLRDTRQRGDAVR
ncbi:tyrosine-type recombinase/integrase [Roseixanthobacter liquoris]|uniref:tyrosine-type recombinase/integrase n=1 Tax=Roseixanthobacter liquoris TaxID=3119921 RepID=UPI0037265774